MVKPFNFFFCDIDDPSSFSIILTLKTFFFFLFFYVDAIIIGIVKRIRQAIETFKYQFAVLTNSRISNANINILGKGICNIFNSEKNIIYINM